MLRRQVAAELRRLRERHQRTVLDVATTLGWSESKLSRIETAHTGVRRADLERLLDLYGVNGADRTSLTSIAAQSRQRAWWQTYGDALPMAYETYIQFEAEASAILTYEVQLVPGLLQTDEYARAVIQTDGVYDNEQVLGQRVAVRMARQAVLTRDPPPRLHVILDEAVLRRPIGGEDVFQRQMWRLIEASRRPTVTLQVLPFSVGAHRALGGSFTYLEFAGSDQPLVYCEGMTGGVVRNRSNELESYLTSFEALVAVSLSEPESAELLSTLAHLQR
jgi:transcriptional regulator with XRE-family HTH domain